MTATERAQAPLSIVLDTSVLTNPATAAQFASLAALSNNPEGTTVPEPPATGPAAAAVRGFLVLAEKAAARAHFYMPPSIYEELTKFLGSIPGEFELIVRLKAPDRYNVRVPGFLLYEVIEDIRERINRGLRVAERAVREVQPDTLEKTLARLRDEYRTALRTGLLDSREDVNLILLARELDAAIVSSDRGVVTWAERVGVRLIHPEQLRTILEKLIGGDMS